jgi:Delta3-Delta2-enoyl-CoA isomerase
LNTTDSFKMAPSFPNLTIESPASAPGVHVIVMKKAPENRLNVKFAQSIINALRYIETDLMKPDAPGAVIISSFSDKFWCTGLELEESDTNIFANADGFYPLLATLVDYPYPTIALITGHTFGGACPFSLSCDYRIMNRKRGFISMPPVNLGLHFDGIGSLPRLKLAPKIARKMLLEAHKWTGEEALKDGIVDEVCDPDKMRDRAVEFAKTVAPRATMGVYGLLRSELWGEALEKFKAISYVHRKRIGTPAKAKI